VPSERPKWCSPLLQGGCHFACSGATPFFPADQNRKPDTYSKEIADLCKIRKNITFHVARLTFATTVTLSNGLPIEMVSKLLGHTKIATTQI